jgi:3-hydroxybutyryl-CoA dehydratase
MLAVFPKSSAIAALSNWQLSCASWRCFVTGQSYILERTLTQQEVDMFVNLTGDSNPIHADQGRDKVPEATAVVPGMLMASMFPAIIGSKFPGALYLSQTLKFRRSAAVGTKVLATVTVAKRSGSRVTFDTSCRDANGSILVDGTALALISMLGEGP